MAFHQLKLRLCVCAFLLALVHATAFDQLSLPVFPAESFPIWHPKNTSAHFVYFRSPEFSQVLSTTSSNEYQYLLRITANQSPHYKTGNGNDQGKLLCSFKLFVNGAVVTVGPGHNIAQLHSPTVPDTVVQAVTQVNIASLLNPAPFKNVIAVASFFNGTGFSTDLPRMQASLCASEDGNSCVSALPAIVSTNATWLSWLADVYHNPAGNSNKTPWYQMPNENLDQQQYPFNWSLPAFPPASQHAWVPAAIQPSFPSSLYISPGYNAAILTRQACSVKHVGGRDYLVDYGQEFDGGVNLTFPVDASTSGWKVCPASVHALLLVVGWNTVGD